MEAVKRGFGANITKQGSDQATGAIHKNLLGTPNYAIEVLKNKINVTCNSIVPFNLQLEKTGSGSNLENNFNEVCWDIFQGKPQKYVFFGDVLMTVADQPTGNVGTLGLNANMNKVFNDPSTMARVFIVTGNNALPIFWAKDLMISSFTWATTDVAPPIASVNFMGYLMRCS